ncbi:MAG: GNAT family N-acetyltransferase [Balneolaceae bacterium]|nr:GNAT family N-acetyltransferase [Balneolaceae bacterium]
MIRLAEFEDLEAIDAIYNQAIENGFLTAHTEPLTRSEREAWFRRHNRERHPIFVYEEQNRVLGWVSLSPYRSGRQALREVAEISFYVDFDSHDSGIGSALVDHCVQQASFLQQRIYIAIIIEGNSASIILMEKFGFERWGYLPEVIHYRDEKRGQVYMGKILH